MEVTSKGLGMTAIVDAAERVLGVFTDGDLRRALDRAADLHSTRMDQVMTAQPKTVRPATARRRGGASHGNAPHHLAGGGRCGRQNRGRAQCARSAARGCVLNARKATPFAKIQLLILDVDGVLTDGRLYFGAAAKRSRFPRARRPRHQTADGCRRARGGVQRPALRCGRRALARTAACPPWSKDAATNWRRCVRLTERLGVDPLNCACIVDDTPDLPLMSAVGLRAAVADAHPIVLSAAHWVATRQAAGRGARIVRCPAARPRRATLMFFRVLPCSRWWLWPSAPGS